MAFSGLSWPALINPLLNGMTVSLNLPVGIAGNGTFEYRTARSAYVRRTWSFPKRSLLDADRNALVALWSQVGGELNSFLFQDPDNNAFTGVTIGTGTQLAVPAVPTLSTSTTGGNLAASTSFTYSITALNAQGETTAGPSASITTGTGSTNSNTITWGAITGAQSYNVYRNGVFLTNTTSLSVLDGGITPTTQVPPTVNGTGTTNYPLLVPVGGVLHPIWHPSGLTVSVSGWSFQIVNNQPVIQYPVGSCPLYGDSVTVSGSYSFAVRFTSMAGYALNVVGTTSGFDTVSMTEVFE